MSAEPRERRQRKERRLLILLASVASFSSFASVPASAQVLVPRGAAVTDSAGTPRSAFSSTEQIAMSVAVQLTAPASTPVTFAFRIVNPLGQQVFLQTGNSAPGGSPGNASSRVAGIPISKFYTVPGQYMMFADASINGQPPVTQSAPFAISSPILTLLYPPDGVRGLQDHPLLFHWSGSGSSRARVQVSDDGSFYRILFSQDVPDVQFSYPDNPSDNRQRLVGGQVYYWRVLGLDANGNQVAQSAIYSFSIQGSAIGGLTRDLAVEALDYASDSTPADATAIPFRVVVRNQGSTTETIVRLRFTVGGVDQGGSPLRVPSLSPNEETTFVVQSHVPSDQQNSLVVACLDLFDDNMLNNCKTMLVAAPKAAPLAPGTTAQAAAEAEGEGQGQQGQQQAQAAWDSLKAKTDPDIQQQLQGYLPSEITGDGMSPADAKQLMDDIRSGKAKILEMTVE